MHGKPTTESLERRSPHGERGLKYTGIRSARAVPNVALLMESVD